MVVRSGLVSAVVAGPPLEIPDIPLTSNPLTVAQDDARPKPLQADLKPVGTNKTVAVVDDDPMLLDVLSRILQREEFDLLVTDYAMPDMQGRELAEHLRQRLPVVLCGSINP